MSKLICYTAAVADCKSNKLLNVKEVKSYKKLTCTDEKQSPSIVEMSNFSLQFDNIDYGT